MLGRSAAIVALVVGLGFHARNVPFWDPAFYVAQLTSICYDGDLALHDDLAVMDASPVVRLQALTRLPASSGALANAFSVGPALLAAPLAAPVVLAQRWADADRLGAPVRVALAAGALGQLAALCVALDLLLARARAGRTAAGLAVACVLVGTPLVVYGFADYSMAHLPSATCAALFAAAALGWARSPTVARAGLAGVSAGLLAIVRWQDVCYAAWLAPIVAERFVHGDSARRRQLARTLPVMAATACAVALIQSAAWWQQFGRLATIPQGGGFMRWGAPQLVEVLFDPAHGLLPWSPVVAVALLGAAWGALSRGGLWRAVHVGGLAVVALEAYVNAAAADWWGGSAFGARRFCSLAPVFALGLAEVFRARRARRVRWAITAAAAVWAAVCVRQVVFDGGEFDGWSLAALAPRASLEDLGDAVERRAFAVPWAVLAVAWTGALQWGAVGLARRAAARRRAWLAGVVAALAVAAAICALRPRAIGLAETWSGYLDGMTSAADVRARGVPGAALDFVEAIVCQLGPGGACPGVVGATLPAGGASWTGTARHLVRALPEVTGAGELNRMLRSRRVVLRALAAEGLRASARSCRVAANLASIAANDPAEVVRNTAARAASEIRQRQRCRVSEPVPSAGGAALSGS